MYIVYIHTHIYMHMYLYVYIYIAVYICIHICLHIHTHIHLHVCIYAPVYIYSCTTMTKPTIIPLSLIYFLISTHTCLTHSRPHFHTCMLQGAVTDWWWVVVSVPVPCRIERPHQNQPSPPPPPTITHRCTQPYTHHGIKSHAR